MIHGVLRKLGKIARNYQISTGNGAAARMYKYEQVPVFIKSRKILLLLVSGPMGRLW